MASLLDQWEAETDVEIQDYSGLTDDHAVCNCGGCGRLLLARSHLGDRVPAYTVTDGDTLPPVVYRNRHVSRHRPSVPECAECYRASRPQVKIPTRYAVDA
jgi:hypothetical protein